jgi:UDP-glucose 4-epimerase
MVKKGSKPAALVTGGAGFIGSHLCVKLLDRGFAVRCYDDLSYGSLENLKAISKSPDFAFFHNDVRDAASLDKACEGASMVIHLAARKIPRYGDALSTLLVNNDGTRNVYDAAAKNRSKVILASTSDVYGKGRPPFKETDDLLLGRSDSRRWSYAVSKAFDEHLALAYQAEQNVDTVVLRFFGTYGPRHHRSWWGGPQSVFIDQVLKDEEMTVHGDGSQTRSFTYIDDLIGGIIAAAESEKATGEIINLGSDEEISIADLARTVSEIIRPGQKPRLKFIPYEDFGGRYEDVERRIPDLSKAGNILDYRWTVKLRARLQVDRKAQGRARKDD